MKTGTVALLSALGMLATSSAVYMLAPQHANGQLATLPIQGENNEPEVAPTSSPQNLADETNPGTFNVGTTLRMEGRIGHPKIAKGDGRSTFVMVEINADANAESKAQGHHLAIVIDRSGSMKGERLPNAIAAGARAVDELGTGDTVSVLAFDTSTTTVVPQTIVSDTNREQIKNQIRTITLGGDTCISCGINEALAELEKTTNAADRMILLSDGEPTAGIRDPQTFESIARQARDRGVGITTIGVGTSYNQKIMGTIALHSDANHYFVENALSLERIFAQEAGKLKQTVARNTTATIKLAPGVRLKHLFDRAFKTAQDGTIVVPLGNFSTGDTKTILAEIALPDGAEGQVELAEASLAFDDQVQDKPGACQGSLKTTIVESPNEASELDPNIATRLGRSKTAKSLLEANELIADGKLAEAQAKLAETESELAAIAKTTKPEALKKDLDAQSKALSSTRTNLTPKTAPTVVRKSAEYANPYML